jgi:hypothetical protein
VNEHPAQRQSASKDIAVNTMFDGLPEMFTHSTNVIVHHNQRNSLAVLVYHLWGDVLNAVEYALTHYFHLTLKEPFLQNSHLGSPYQKWAKFSNDDFKTCDQCLQRLIPALFQLYDQTNDMNSRTDRLATKDSWIWFSTVKTEYASCVISGNDPELTLSAINVADWLDPVGTRFIGRLPWDRASHLPPIITKGRVEIADRAVIGRLQTAGVGTLAKLRQIQDNLAVWLRSNCTMDEITALHRGTLSDCYL